MNQNVWEATVKAKATVVVYNALQQIFQLYGIETDYKGVILEHGDIVQMASGKRLDISTCIKLPFENNKSAKEIWCDPDKANHTALYGCGEVIKKIVARLATHPKLSAFAGYTIYKEDRLYFIYGLY